VLLIHSDRSHVYYDPDALYDRMAYRHVARPGDFWLESLQIEDFLVTVYQPDNFRPVSGNLSLRIVRY
jgi:distribution and morphology protein 31